MSANSTPRRLAERLGRLGTETAYAVSDEAKQLAATGLKIYPYHIGDLNFATPDVFVTGTLIEAWNQRIFPERPRNTNSCPHLGHLAYPHAYSGP